MCEDLTNQNEFKVDLNVNNTHGSVQNTMTVASTCISQQCDNLRVDEWSNLSRTQKKRLKANSKGKVAICF